MNQYISGNDLNRSDCKVIYTPKKTGRISINVSSKVDSLYGDAIRELITNTLKDLDIKSGSLEVIDNGSVPFIIQSRIEAAISKSAATRQRSLPKLINRFIEKSSRDRFRRSRLYIPGNQPKLMLNAGIHSADGIILDLEDSVSIDEKISARIIVRNALRVLDFFGSEKMVRINQGKLGDSDLEYIVPENVNLILVPKVEEASDISVIESKISDIKKSHKVNHDIYLMPIIESAKGVLNAYSIAQASKNIVALAIGLEDYTADLGVERTSDDSESLFARNMIVNAAKAAGVQAIDTVFSDVADTDGLKASVKEAKGLGFEGKGCIHPRQIHIINSEFAPTQLEIDKAKEIIIAFDKAKIDGIGVVSIGSKMIDPPVVKRAERTIRLAISSKLLSKSWKRNEARKK